MVEWRCRSNVIDLEHWMETSGHLHDPAVLLSGRAPGTFSIGDCVGPRTGMDYAERRKILHLPGLKLLPLSRADCTDCAIPGEDNGDFSKKE
jgi:hypothetical protein